MTFIVILPFVYFLVVIVALLILKPLMERRYGVKISWEGRATYWDVRGGTPTQRFFIALIPIALGLVGVALCFIVVFSLPPIPPVPH
jgi:hypothetical protein